MILLSDIQLIKVNIYQNLRFYLVHIFSYMLFVILFFYSFMLLEHPWFGRFFDASDKDVIEPTFIGITFLLYMMLMVIYQAFVSRKSITFHTLHGVPIQKIRWVMFLINLTINTISIVLGVLLALGFSPLFFQFSALLMETSVFPFQFPTSSLIVTFFFFGTLAIISSISMVFVLRSNKTTVTEYKKPKMPFVMCAAGLGILVAVWMKIQFLHTSALLTGSSLVTYICIMLGSIFLIYYAGKLLNNSLEKEKNSKLKTLAGLSVVCLLLMSVSNLKEVAVGVEKHQLFYKDFAFTFYLAAYAKDKSKLSVYDHLLQKQLQQKHALYQKQSYHALELQGEDGRFPLAIRYSDYLRLATLIGDQQNHPLSANEAIYFFAMDDYFHTHLKSKDLTRLQIVGYPVTFRLQSKMGSIMPMTDVMVISDSVYNKLAKINNNDVDYTTDDEYIAYLVPQWMKGTPTYSSPEQTIGGRIVNIIEGSPKYTPTKDNVTNYEGNNDDYDLFFRSPYGVGGCDVGDIILSFMHFVLAIPFLFFYSNWSGKQRFVYLSIPLVLTILEEFLFSITKFAFTSIALVIPSLLFIGLLVMFPKKPFRFYPGK